MLMIMVADPSAVMAWCFKDEVTDHSVDMLGRAAEHGIIVPTLWFADVANSLLLGEKRMRTTHALIDEFTAMLEQLHITVDHEGEINCFERIMPLSRKHGLTSYDALYLELAQRWNVPLLSRDKALRNAAIADGITLL